MAFARSLYWLCVSSNHFSIFPNSQKKLIFVAVWIDAMLQNNVPFSGEKVSLCLYNWFSMVDGFYHQPLLVSQYNGENLSMRSSFVCVCHMPPNIVTLCLHVHYISRCCFLKCTNVCTKLLFFSSFRFYSLWARIELKVHKGSCQLDFSPFHF